MAWKEKNRPSLECGSQEILYLSMLADIDHFWFQYYSPHPSCFWSNLWPYYFIAPILQAATWVWHLGFEFQQSTQGRFCMLDLTSQTRACTFLHRCSGSSLVIRMYDTISEWFLHHGHSTWTRGKASDFISHCRFYRQKNFGYGIHYWAKVCMSWGSSLEKYLERLKVL